METITDDTVRGWDAWEDGQSLIGQLADSMYDLNVEDLPEAAMQEAARCILDTLGCIAAGAGHPDAKAFESGESLLFASEGPGTIIRESRQWAFEGDIFELNDLVGGHASIGTVSALLAEAYHHPETRFEDLLLSTAVGIETTTRLFEAHSWEKKSYADTGTVVTSILSSIGVTAGLGRLKKLSRAEYRNALAIACATAPWGPSEVIFGYGGQIKPSQFGAGPAETGYRAVLSARSGMTGPPFILESPMGFFAAVAHSFDRDLLLGGAGWRLEHAQRKLHACCGYIHATLDALQAVRDRGNDLSNATRIDIEIPEAVLEAVGKDRVPVSANDARFHLKYMAALVVAGHYPIRPDHSTEFANYLKEGAVSERMPTIHLSTMRDVPQQEGNRFNSSRIRVQLEGSNEVVTASCDAPRGTYRNPLSPDDLAEKFVSLASPSVDSELASRLTDALIHGIGAANQASSDLEARPLDDIRNAIDSISERRTPCLDKC